MGSDPTDQDDMIATVTKVMAEMVDRLAGRGIHCSAPVQPHELSRRYVERTRPVRGPPAGLACGCRRRRTTTVRWRHGLVAAVEHDGDRVVLRLPDRTMTFPTSCADAMQALHRGKSPTRVACRVWTALMRQF